MEDKDKKKGPEEPYLNTKQKLFLLLMILIGIIFFIYFVSRFEWPS